MAKGYWVGCYREIKDPAALAEYAKHAGPAILAGGGKFLARGGRVQAFDAGIGERTVVVEFPSFEQALATYEGVPRTRPRPRSSKARWCATSGWSRASNDAMGQPWCPNPEV